MAIYPVLSDLPIRRPPVVTGLFVLACFLIHLTATPETSERWIYQVDSPGLLTALSAGLLHANWQHLLGNMLFFIAFAPVLEIVVGSYWRYLAIIVATHLAAVLWFTGFHWGEEIGLLGFSAAVSGVMGAGAYMIPRVRIQTIILLGLFPLRTFIPYGLLVGWFLAWDLYYLIRYESSAAIAFSAHVGGAVTGYFLARWMLNERKWQIQDELYEAIDEARSRRSNISGLVSSRRYFSERERKAIEQREANSRHTRFMTRLYELAQTDQPIPALLEVEAFLTQCPTTLMALKELWAGVEEWSASRFQLCLARWYMTELIRNGNAGAAMLVAEFGWRINPNFLVADVHQLAALAREAEEAKRFRLAYDLVRDSGRRYGPSTEESQLALIEARLLITELERPEAAKPLLAPFLQQSNHRFHQEASSLAALAERLG